MTDVHTSFKKALTAPQGNAGFGLAEEEANKVAVVQFEDEAVEMRTGDVAIAAITSCTNTSNPYVMIGAGLVAKKRSNSVFRFQNTSRHHLRQDRRSLRITSRNQDSKRTLTNSDSTRSVTAVRHVSVTLVHSTALSKTRSSVQTYSFRLSSQVTVTSKVVSTRSLKRTIWLHHHSSSRMHLQEQSTSIS